MNPFERNHTNIITPYQDLTLEELESELLANRQDLDTLRDTQVALKTEESKLKNEVLRRLRSKSLKSYKGSRVSFTVTTKKTVSIDETDASLQFAQDNGFTRVAIDTKSLEKALDKDNLPEWARLSTTEYITIKR
jgi:hypothetical protein